MIELAIALLVISISVLAFYQMFITGSLLITEQYHRRVALEKAQAWMEKMKYYENELDTVPRDFARKFTEFIVEPSRDQDGIEAKCRIEVEHSDDRDPETAVPYYSEVTVVYEWEEPSERSYKVELRSKF
jgi:hypothetical protein